MTLPASIVELVERFERDRAGYRSGQYNETQARHEFIDPLFEALGWDVNNRTGYGEAYKDVIHEDSIRVGAGTKAPDYCFRVGGTRKFFVEAKNPSVNVRDAISPAFQLRRYAWSAKLDLSILTDFEEFAAYDCRITPAKDDQPSAARIMYLTYRDYAARWDEIAGVFSKEAVLKGSFDQYAAAKRGKKGTAEVDHAFLAEIQRWRELLARNIALRNPSLDARELNTAVQQIVDRIIFLRICEDRGIEMYGRLQSLLNGGETYARLCQDFRAADQRYNSGLFHFEEEKGRSEGPDGLTLALQIDDKPLKEIVGRLYYPDSPYEFSQIPADILGQVYEQFLGQVIRLTAGHQAKIEDKPEVKKAGGVFYTPTYIVEYIVKNTVGRLVEQTSEVSKTSEVCTLRILDPACGSGSFLIGAYQYLLDWRLGWYLAHDPLRWAKGKAPAVYQTERGEWRLTTAERKRILLDHIYGVDIDPQAVEVTKLSLLLKVLEGESEASLSPQLAMFHARALPDLGHNIQCGNSLIGPDFYEGRQASFLDAEERYRVNPFDWQAAFPEVFGKTSEVSETSEVSKTSEVWSAGGFDVVIGKTSEVSKTSEVWGAGGFDVVIGNPPYIRIQALKEWAPLEVEFYKGRYAAASKGNYDIYVVFVEKGLSLLNGRGRLGFILPHKFFNAQYGEPLRKLLAEGKHLSHVVHFGDQQVFANATTYTCLMFLDRAGSEQVDFRKADDLAAWRANGAATAGTVPANSIGAKEWNFTIGSGATLCARLRAMPITLGSIAAKMAQGIRTSANEVYVLDMVSADDKIVRARSKQLEKEVDLERVVVSLFLQGREIKPYRLLPSGKVVVIPYTAEGGRVRLLSDRELQERAPHAYSYLRENKTYLESREGGRMRGSNWYAYIYPKNIEVMRTSKILVPDIADRASFALDEAGEYAFTSGYAITLRESVHECPKYVLGLLNSKVLNFYLKNVSTPMRGGFFRYFTQYIEQLPIRTIDFSDPADAGRHAAMVALVETMLGLQRQLAAARTAHDKTLIQRQIEATDQQIDRLVYELYGLTAEEIGVVEGP